MKEIFKKEDINEIARVNRQFNYEKHTDPMFMQVQRGEITQAEWQAEIDKIKAQYPYVDEDIEMDIPEIESTELEEI